MLASSADYFHLFTGSIVEVLALRQVLAEKKIFPVIKDESESARLAGFGISYPSVQQVYLHKDEIEIGKKILDQLF